MLQTYRRHPHNETVLRMALEGLIEIEEGCLENAEAEAAARHVEDCGACRGWLDDLYPQRRGEAQERARRASLYCCLSMQFAVRDPAAQTRFSFTFFRREDPCWCINDDYCFARHCPWCGESLPDGPFEAGE